MKKCSELPTDTMGSLNNIMVSADWDEFIVFINAVYCDHKRKIHVIDHPEYLRLAEAEYRTLYHKQKWTATNNPASGFFVGDGNKQGVVL